MPHSLLLHLVPTAAAAPAAEAAAAPAGEAAIRAALAQQRQELEAQRKAESVALAAAPAVEAASRQAPLTALPANASLAGGTTAAHFTAANCPSNPLIALQLRNDTGAFAKLLQAATVPWLEDPAADLTLLAPLDLALQARWRGVVFPRACMCAGLSNKPMCVVRHERVHAAPIYSERASQRVTLRRLLAAPPPSPPAALRPASRRLPRPRRQRKRLSRGRPQQRHQRRRAARLRLAAG